MKTLIIRSISGVVLVALIVALILLGKISVLLMMMMIFTFSFLEFKRMFKIRNIYLTSLLLVLGLSLLGLAHLIMDQTIDAKWITGYGLIFPDPDHALLPHHQKIYFQGNKPSDTWYVMDRRIFSICTGDRVEIPGRTI